MARRESQRARPKKGETNRAQGRGRDFAQVRAGGGGGRQTRQLCISIQRVLLRSGLGGAACSRWEQHMQGSSSKLYEKSSIKELSCCTNQRAVSSSRRVSTKGKLNQRRRNKADRRCPADLRVPSAPKSVNLRVSDKTF